MNYRRSYHTLTVLPDGKVLATGGQTTTDGVDETTGVLGTEIWDPATDAWTPTAFHRRPRLYHSARPPARRARAARRRRRVRQREEREVGRDLLAALPLQGPAPDDQRRARHAQTTASRSPWTRPTRPASARCRSSAWARSHTTSTWTSASSRWHADAVRRRARGRAGERQRGPARLVHGLLIDDHGVPSVGKIVKVEKAADTQAPTAPRFAAATRQPRAGRAQLVGLHGQRGRDRVPHAPVHHGGLHAVGREPGGHRHERHQLPGHRPRGRAPTTTG